MLTKPAVASVRRLSAEERVEKIHIFEELLEKLGPFIESEAAKRAVALPNNSLDIDDLRAIGHIQAWIATVTWDPKRGASLVNWARQCIWTNMSVVMGGLYQLKRVPRASVDGEEVTVRPVSLFTENGEGALLYEALEDRSYPDPIGVLIADELYKEARKKLLTLRDRVAAAVLRLLVFPDGELLRLCEEYTQRKRKKIRITNRSLAKRLSVTTCRVAEARATIRKVFKECSESD